MRFLTSLLALGLAFTAPALGQSLVAQSGEQNLLREVDGRSIIPFSTLRNLVSRQIGGRLIGSELDESQARSGLYIYRMTFLQDGGTVVRVDVDARNGRILGVEGR
jgi:uncharacterized membrane protein YkoI